MIPRLFSEVLKWTLHPHLEITSQPQWALDTTLGIWDVISTHHNPYYFKLDRKCLLADIGSLLTV